MKYYYTHAHLMALYRDYLGGLVPERQNQSGFYWSNETVSVNGISWAICKSSPRSRQITMPAPHHSGFPAIQPTASKYWRRKDVIVLSYSKTPKFWYKKFLVVEMLK